MIILYFIDSLSSGGGTERVLTTKVNWLANRPNDKVYVVTLDEDQPPFFTLDPRVNVIHLKGIRGTSYKRKGQFNLYREAIQKVVDDLKPDVLIATAGMAVETLPKIKSTALKILEFHYTKNYLVNFVNGIQNLRLKKLHVLKMMWLQHKLARTARKYDRFVGLTAKDVGLWGIPKNMTFVHNPLSFFSQAKSSCLNKKIIAVGSWTPAKGMDQLLEAFGPLAKKYPDWSVELYGAGQDEQRLKDIIARFDMQSQVNLNPPVKDIPSRLIDASIYAFPSRSDGFGLVITEAMECGLPTVAMDCPCGPCEILDESTGIVVPEQDIPAFRNALERLMNNDDLRIRMGQAASKAVKRFYPDSIMPKWLSLFPSKSLSD